MENTPILKQINLANQYLNLISDAGYQLIDLNMVEPFQVESKDYHPDSIVFERKQQLFSLRSDWTRSILNYNNAFQISQQKFGYFGPVIRQSKTYYQAGVELFQPSMTDMVQSINLHLSFVEALLETRFTVIVVNHDLLLDMYIELHELSEEVRALVIDKNLSTLRELLGNEHPFYQLMILPVSQQFDRVDKQFGTSKPMQMIHSLKETLRTPETRFILDLSFRSPQTYYNGFYFQAFLGENTPVLSGGQYADGAFGIGINLSTGGLL